MAELKEFKVLEEKVRSLVTLTQQLQAHNKDLQKEVHNYQEKIADLSAENAQLAEEKDQVTARLEALERSKNKGVKEIETLSKERAAAKHVVDDLIKSIESLVEAEKQQ